MRKLTPILLMLVLSACAQSKKAPDQASTTVPAKSSPTVELAAVGDIYMGSRSRKVLKKEGYDYPFTKTRHLFQDADIVLANLEGPLTDSGIPTPDKRFVFKSPAKKVLPALKNAGINTVTLANNHIMDYGDEGLTNTLKALDKEKIAYFGAGNNVQQARKPYITKINGLTVGLLGYSLTFPESYWATKKSAGTAFGYEDHVREDILALKEQCDAIIVSFHWGQELKTALRPYQTRLAHLAIDSGANVVIGHHPHIMQGIEAYKEGVIFYSLGNYVFGSYSNSVHYGGLANITLDQQGFKSMQLHILDINNFRTDLQPALMEGDKFETATKEILELSQQLGTGLKVNQNTITLSRE